MTAEEIKKSKANALEKIKQFLDASDVDGQFADRDGNYYSKDKFIIQWNANYKGMLCEFTIDKTDTFYADFSGYKAIYAVRNLFLEKQLKGYSTIERALIDVGLKLCPPKEQKAFFDKYAVPYNEKIKSTT